MAFFDCHFFSDVLALTVSAHVLIPQQTVQQIGMAGNAKGGLFPSLYLLHGLSDDHTIWSRRTSIERYAAERGIAVVMPAVARSWYQNMASGPRYWSFISEELPAVMQRFFPLSKSREDNFAAGLSMGGYGALRLGLARPERFAAVASLSGALDLEARLKTASKPGSRMSRAEWVGTFGEELTLKPESDVYALPAEVVKSGKERPQLYISCGTEDELLPDSQKLSQQLTALGWDHEYSEGPGDHDWNYWDDQIQKVLKWLPVR